MIFSLGYIFALIYGAFKIYNGVLGYGSLSAILQLVNNVQVPFASLSNVMPKETHDICQKYLDGDVNGSLKLQLDALELVDALFCEVNPIPVKAAVAKMGYCDNYVRLPLTPMESANAEKLYDLMRKENLID